MPLRGDGPAAVGAMWAMTAISLIFVVLRAYTRLIVVKGHGVDDYVYYFAFVLLLLYTVATTVSGHYGLGQNMWDLDGDHQANAILWEAIGQTAAVLGMAIAKWSLGFFLLRIVHKFWHKVVIWVSVVGLMAGSISVLFVFWLELVASHPNPDEDVSIAPKDSTL
ncbi:hypothetical protein F4779DRAFT_357028 [Xylariaceae sp. FL0662B]|nr:hypothetical protein F4779DRAFT_357028 [Xylariaceae sp. FL0662B]